MKMVLVVLAALILVFGPSARRECFAQGEVAKDPFAPTHHYHNADRKSGGDRKKAVDEKIAATGTVEPEEMASVGAEVAGKIVSLGKDPRSGKAIDYGSAVEAGSVLAQIDPEPYQLKVELERAGVTRAQAELTLSTMNLRTSNARWQNAQQQRIKKTISDADFEVAKLDYETAEATVKVAEATVAKSKAALALAELQLSHTTIKSPIKGVLIDRRVNVGDLVAPGAASSGLFIVGNIEKFQVWASVNEADIAKIHEKQAVHMTYNALPDTVFEGEVKQIRLNATSTQNVVMYTVVISVSDPKHQLIPFLTAYAQFQ